MAGPSEERDERTYNENLQRFRDFSYSSERGDCYDPDSNLRRYRGSCGPGTVEFSYDPETQEVVNGQVREIDICG